MIQFAVEGSLSGAYSHSTARSRTDAPSAFYCKACIARTWAMTEPHISAITMVRAGILRAAISTVMACLDPADRRGNRASVGQILQMLEDDCVVAVFPGPGTGPEAG
jgi:hypothetical protein